MITQSVLKSLVSYDPETGLFTWLSRPETDRFDRAWNARFAGTEAGSLAAHGAIVIRVLGERYLAHRLAWLYVHGEFPREEIDHLNGDATYNALANLREASRSQNMRNTIRASKFARGVRQNGNGFAATIVDHGRRTHLGTFRTEGEAEAAYRSAAERVHGEFAQHLSRAA